MNQYKQHSIFKAATIFIVLCLVLPAVVKFSHVFSHHEHVVCVGENQSHFHEIDMDCKFFKFQLGNSFYAKIEDFSLTENLVSNKLNTKYHSYLRSHQQLTTYLRGPPNLT